MSEGSIGSVGDAVNALNNANSQPSTAESTPAPTQQPSTTPQPTQQPGNVHPAWQPVLDKIPAGFHDVLRPHLQEWDRNVQQGYERIQSQYAPYKQFLDAKVDPGQIQQALQLVNLLNSDPESVYRSMGEHFGFAQGEQGPPNNADEFDLGEQNEQQFDLEKDPRFQQLQQQQAQINQALMQAQQAQVEKQADADVERWHAAGEKTLSDAGITPSREAWNMIYGAAFALGQATGDAAKAFESAVADYVNHYKTIRAMPLAGSSAPNVLPASGGLPSANANRPKLGSKDLRNIGVEMLNAVNRQS